MPNDFLEPLTMSSLWALDTQAALNIWDGADMLSGYGMQLFHKPWSGYWLGLTSMQISEHERWLLFSNNGIDWYRLKRNVGGGPRGSVQIGGRTPISDYMAFWQVRVEELAQWDKPVSVPNFISLYRALQGKRDLMQRVANLLPPRDLHDLIHHYESWQASHGEAEGLPRQLILRSYGLAGADTKLLCAG